MNYDQIRHFADTIGLVALVLMFGIALWRALRPAAKPLHEQARTIPFRDEGTLDD